MLFDDGVYEDDGEEYIEVPEEMGGAASGAAGGAWRGPQLRLKPSQALKLVPSRLISRVWGKMNSIPIPKRARSTIYRSYSWAFGVNLDEIRCASARR